MKRVQNCIQKARRRLQEKVGNARRVFSQLETGVSRKSANAFFTKKKTKKQKQKNKKPSRRATVAIKCAFCSAINCCATN
jgi:hypothetical protein